MLPTEFRARDEVPLWRELPTETSEQKQLESMDSLQLPDLTEKQLQDLGFKSKYEWKVNAEMLGFYSQDLTIEEFIEKKTDKTIKTFLKGKQIDVYDFSGTISSDSFPVAFEGDVVISERFCFNPEGTEFRDTKLFTILTEGAARSRN